MTSNCMHKILRFSPRSCRNPPQILTHRKFALQWRTNMPLFQDLVVENLPHLRAFAHFLARDRALADDLVQETVLRALCNMDKFEPGTNMRAWLSTILRNQFYN